MVKTKLPSGIIYYEEPYSEEDLKELAEMEHRAGLNWDGGGIIRGPRKPQPAPEAPPQGEDDLP